MPYVNAHSRLGSTKIYVGFGETPLQILIHWRQVSGISDSMVLTDTNGEPYPENAMLVNGNALVLRVDHREEDLKEIQAELTNKGINI